MVTAIVLIGADRGKVNPLAEALAERAEVSEVYSVSGSYDLIAIIRVGSNDELAGFVTDFMANLDGIAHTETMLAFRAHDTLNSAPLHPGRSPAHR